MQPPLRGMITPLATPLSGYDELDRDGLTRLIEHVLAAGVHGIFLLGTTGEFCSLSYPLRDELIQRSCRQVAGRVPVLVGISDTSIAESMHMADTALENGASAVVAAAPYYFQHSQADLLGWIEKLTDRLPLPLFLYNIPHLTGNSFAPETIRRAADIPGVIGLKDSTHDREYLRRTLELLKDRPNFRVFAGPEAMLLEAMRMGANGGVCGGSNLAPALLVQLYEAAARGEFEQAELLQRQVSDMGELLYTVGVREGAYLRGIKGALGIAGLCNPSPAPPYVPFTDAEYALLTERFRKIEHIAQLVSE